MFIPKTLVRYLVDYQGRNHADPELRAVLKDILGTAGQPRAAAGRWTATSPRKPRIWSAHTSCTISSCTICCACAYPPEKVLRLALIAFDGRYDEAVIRFSWLKVFSPPLFQSAV